MKIIYDRETQKNNNNKENKQRQKRARGDRSEKVKEWELNDFAVHLG